MALTSFQKKAAQGLGKNLLVSAGAGTGKTRVLVEKVLYLLRTQKASITELLVLTFMDKAANEIKSRLSKDLRELGLEQPRRDLERAAISTFHGFASRLLKEHPVEAGVDPDFRVLESEQAELLKEESLDRTLAALHEAKSGAFGILKVYGEDAVRAGVLKVFTAARHEGKTLKDFFEENAAKEKTVCGEREQTLASEARSLIASLEEIDSGIWEGFLKNKAWDWQTLRDFKEWRSLFKGKRKTGWKEWRGLLEDLLALRIGTLTAASRGQFEELALAFEAVYGALKREKGYLDFDDLQMKAVGLFREGRPVLRKLRERYQRQFKFILVDEFQDTNFLQLEFFERLSSGDNLFLVGDYKQSIFGFRGAEPRLFLAKEELYKNGEEGERIPLTQSFRSDPPILDFVNRFFETLWSEDRFPFEPLTPDPDRKPGAYNPTGGPAVEVMVTDINEDEDMRYARFREARAIAAKVRELNEKEKIPFGKMAVLFQAMTSSGIYEDAFKTAGVPYFIVAGRGFYEQPEVQDMMSCLSHLEQPFADIPLAATLRSPLFHITDDTLFWLSRRAKSGNEKAPLYGALHGLPGIPEILPEQRTRLENFIKRTDAWRALKDRLPIAELIDRILEDTGYELSVLMDPKGVRRYANLKKLIAIARECETYERVPLAAFLNILKRLKAQNVRESEAQTTPETGAEAVRMMSVHGAKGLEFPVVFVADMGHQGSGPDTKAVIAHAADGYAMQARDETDLEMREPFFFKWVDAEIKKRDKEERKRLFYVAVTRAESRLFLSGVHKKKKKEKESYREMATWMDWTMAISEGFPVQWSRDEGSSPEFPGKKKEDFRAKVESVMQHIEWNAASPAAPAFSPLRSIDLPVSAYVLFRKDPEEFWRTYQIGWVVGENEWAGEEGLLKDEDFSATDFGTAMHGFFEHLDFSDPERHLAPEFLDRIFGRFGTEAVTEAARIIRDFLKQPVFKMLRGARQVRRETGFVLNERRGLIHGKIDVLFEDEKGDWHILDYKTATGDEEAVRKSAYDLQLEIYALAAQRILKLPVRSAIIYYLKNQKAVTLPFPAEKSADAFDALAVKARELQQKVLEYSNERMAKESAEKDVL